MKQECLTRDFHTRFPTLHRGARSHSPTPCTMGTSFTDLCQQGKLKEAQQLFAEGEVHLWEGNYYAFRIACGSGHLAVAQWLWRVSCDGDRINYRTENDAAFRWACEAGHLDVAQWLWDLGRATGNPVNHHARRYDAFIGACRNGHLRVAQWLWGLGGMPRSLLHELLSETWRRHNGVRWWLMDMYLVMRGSTAKVRLRRKWRGVLRSLALLHRTYMDFLERYYAPGGKGFDRAHAAFLSKMA